MNLRAISAVIAMISAMLFVSTAVRADDLPDARYFSYVTTSGLSANYLFDQGLVSGADCGFGVCSTGTATTTDNSASVRTNSPIGSEPATAFASLFVHYEAHGPDDMIVPLHVIANLSASAGDQDSNMQAFAGLFKTSDDDFDFGTYQGVGTGFLACSGGPCNFNTGCGDACTDTIHLSADFDVPSNTDFEFFMVATCEGGANGASPNCAADADPMVTIDPGFLATHPGFNLEYSSNFSNTVGTPPGPTGGPGVPEPAAWAMMLVGFGALGAAMRARRRPAAMAF
ncbi:PEPxxWA-CTERM sorting domain-containing protein [Phenylobacterium sp.]|uniref:PEPxxWA-CTERM sorting domain-containing protein n=1 Tax=Phenylobacterium sp. TaxID=1871053 RepID=UPI002C51CB6A|nr:PEPxxWA-CTERM sorting domain-containing protein [Phenylobacterium sp.]HLZ75654.1 PEPxxWA-CTERM sorting domain-containing protein [Phenylobacterium sp.]